MHEKAVITGMGVLSSISSGYTGFIDGLKTGRDGIAAIAAFDASELPGNTGGEILDFIETDHFSPKQMQKTDRSVRLTLMALREAVAESGLVISEEERTRTGVYFGSTLGGMINGTNYYEHLRETGYPKTSLLRDYPLFSAGCHIAAELGAEGPNMTFSTACSSSNIAIGYGAMMIAAGKLDVAIVGGVDPMAKMTMAGFNCLRNVTTGRIRPFDKGRTGVVLSEGAGILILESRARMERRGAHAFATVSGFGASADAYHMTAPDASGRGAHLAMKKALNDARIDSSEIGYVNAHGTGTKHNDAMEVRAIKKLSNDPDWKIPVSSTKSMHGHALGATGALEAIACVGVLNDNFLPPTINFETPDPKCVVDCIPNEAREARVNHILSNNIGFGGNNASIVISRPNA